MSTTSMPGATAAIVAGAAQPLHRWSQRPSPLRALEEQCQVYGPKRAYEAAVPDWMRFLRRVAQRLARDDAEIAHDLVQEGLARLWELDPSRFDKADRRWMCHQLVVRMRSAIKRERRQQGGKRRVEWNVAAVELPLAGLGMDETGAGDSLADQLLG